MDFMNLFSKVGKEIIEEENEQESSFKESEELNAGLSVDDIAEIEDLKRSIVMQTVYVYIVIQKKHVKMIKSFLVIKLSLQNLEKNLSLMPL